jgi:hypothetical protein
MNWIQRTIQKAMEKRARRRNLRLTAPIECSIVECGATTREPHSADPRKRWIVDGVYKLEDGSFVKYNFCPACIVDIFPGATTEFFESLEKTELFIKEDVNVRPEEKKARLELERT